MTKPARSFCVCVSVCANFWWFIRHVFKKEESSSPHDMNWIGKGRWYEGVRLAETVMWCESPGFFYWSPCTVIMYACINLSGWSLPGNVYLHVFMLRWIMMMMMMRWWWWWNEWVCKIWHESIIKMYICIWLLKHIFLSLWIEQYIDLQIYLVN